MATLAATALANPLVRKVGKQIVGKAADAGTGAVLGGIGGAIGGRKGKKVGRAVAKGLGRIRKSIFGFASGGKVRKVPQIVKGYNNGGVVTTPIVRPLPAPRRKGRRKK